MAAKFSDSHNTYIKRGSVSAVDTTATTNSWVTVISGYTAFADIGQFNIKNTGANSIDVQTLYSLNDSVTTIPDDADMFTLIESESIAASASLTKRIIVDIPAWVKMQTKSTVNDNAGTCVSQGRFKANNVI